MTAFLEIADIRKSFGQKTILHGVSLNVHKGEMLCILGPSGCGKTTLLRCLAGLEEPDSGNICLEGKDITRLAPEKRHFGFVFQNYALFPNLTVAENICYGLRGPEWTKKRQQERVQELLELVALPDRAQQYPGQLSGGQQQRVALVRALAPDPGLLLLDEPLSALDAQVRMQLREDLRAIQHRLGLTAVLVTHDQQEALTLADRIIVMQGGRIEQVDSPAALYGEPATRFVAEFIGAMNVLALPELTGETPFGIRYEHVLVDEATEVALAQPHTFVAKVESCRLFGPFYRLELLLGDQTTRIFADIPTSLALDTLQVPGRLVAVTLPKDRHCRWGDV